MDIEERHLSRHGSSPDYLTCGDCAREFQLENITLFIAHKKWGCTEKARARRCTDGSDDIGEDTSSPLTCSACSRVFMTARGLLHHVQYEHGMTICLKRGPLIILDKSLRCPGGNTSANLETKERPLKSLSAISEFPEGNTEGSVPSPSAYSGTASAGIPSVRQKDNNLYKSEALPRIIDEQKQKEHHRSLSQSSIVSLNSVRNGFDTEECVKLRSLNDQLQPEKQVVDTSNNIAGRERRSRSSSLPKKRWYSVVEHNDEYDKDLRAFAPHDEKFALTSCPTDAISTDCISPKRKDCIENGSVRESEEEGLGGTKNRKGEENIDTGQYYSESQAMESPICLVVSKASEFHGTAEDHVKNVILKKLLLHDGVSESVEYVSTEDPHESTQEISIMPKLEIDSANLLINPFDANYSEVEDCSQSTLASSVSNSSQQRERQRSYMRRARYPHFPPEVSMDQSIEQIIRATVSKEANDLNASNDSLERSPPHLLSPHLTRSHTLPAVTNSFQGIPTSMSSLVASHHLGAVAGYFSPQNFPTAGHRRCSLGPLPHPILARSAATSPGSMSAPEKGLDMSNSPETSGLYSTIRSGSSMPRLALGYQPKTGMDMMTRGANDFTRSLGHASSAIYRREVNIHNWTAMTEDAYVNSVRSRFSSEEQPTEAHEISPDFNDEKALMDGSLKKRRYPTSRPFKCTHCDQAFNQRIHLKKHMSKHTGVKPFKCQQCDYSTVERSHLKVHYRIHTGEKPYKCMFCDYATAQNSTLKIHLKRHHEGQQLSPKDTKAGKHRRHDDLRAPEASAREDPETRDTVKLQENHEIDVRQGQGFNQSNHGTNKGYLSTVKDEKNPRSGTPYLNRSRSPRHDSREVETDPAIEYHKHENYQINTVVPAIPAAADGDGHSSRNIVRERRSTPSWHDLSEARQKLHLDYTHGISCGKDSKFLSDRSLKVNNNATRETKEEKGGPCAPLHYSTSSDCDWGGQKQVEGKEKDMTKHDFQDEIQVIKEQGSSLKACTGMSQESAMGNVSAQKIGATVTEKPDEDDEDVYSDVDMEHVDYDAVKLVIPDKEFVRG